MHRVRLALLVIALLCASAVRAFASVPSITNGKQLNRIQMRNREQEQADARRRVLATMAVQGGGDAKPSRSAPQQLWNKYLGQLDRRPLITKAWTSTIIGCIGDTIAQVLEARTKGIPFVFDTQRTAIYIFCAVAIGSTAVHYWYNFLDQKVANPNTVKGKWNRVFRQLAVDQTVGCTILNAGFYIAHTIVSAVVMGRVFPLGALADTITGKLSREMWPMLINNWKLWPAANFINFSLVPPQLRVLFANFVAIFWNIYLSGSANR